MRRDRLVGLALPVVLIASWFGTTPVAASGVGNLAQGTQSDSAYTASAAKFGVTNVFATSRRISCYRPEVPYFGNPGQAKGCSGMSPGNGGAPTGKDPGATRSPSQSGSNAGFPAAE